MNMTSLIRRIKLNLGLMALSLPFDNVDDMLREVIEVETLKAFSTYLPRKMTIDFDLSTMNCIKQDFKHSIYELPLEYFENGIMYVINVEPLDNTMGGQDIMTANAGLSIGDFQSLAMTQVTADLASLYAAPITFKYEEPNLLHLYNMSTVYGKINLTIALEHTKNLMTITKSSEESFYELAYLDIKRFLYNSLKHYNEIETAYGRINLRIDDWAGAEDERKGLIERWSQFYHLDNCEPVYII